MVTIDFKLADTKLKSTEAYLLKLGKNLLQEFKVIYIFCKNAVLNIPQMISQRFLYLPENNKTFL